MQHSPVIVVSSGEPAGIGPDLCILLAAKNWRARIAIVGDVELLRSRAAVLGVEAQLVEKSSLTEVTLHEPGTLQVIHVPLSAVCKLGELNAANADYVLRILKTCTQWCVDGNADAMVTAPVHKGTINDAGHVFSGHTELLAELTNAPLPVMLLCADSLRVALVTTHLPLSEVSAAITQERIIDTLQVLRADLISQFGIKQPRISVCGLNPHSGEGGHLGREEIEVIEPALEKLRKQPGWILNGPLPADTLFTPRHLKECDAVLAMYHDQGLPTLKYAGFGSAVNVTLGLPIIRTSVDHGTALDLAGTGQIDDGSMAVAMNLAIEGALARTTS
ncbi:MAG: 4-hydroxythreonine-4-phosphate dehydrogenase PdxA [Gammaproteobacteria bacterium]